MYNMFRMQKYLAIMRYAFRISKQEGMYEYIIETEIPLSELKTFPNCKGT